MKSAEAFPYSFTSAQSMLDMSVESGLSIAEMKQGNEVELISTHHLNEGLDFIWKSMQRCIEKGLSTKGILLGGLNIPRRAQALHEQLVQQPC